MTITKNDVFTGFESLKELVAELKPTDHKILDGVTHVDVIVGSYSRCYHLNDLVTKLKRLENERDGEHRAHRKKVDTFLQSLPFEDGCRGKRK